MIIGIGGMQRFRDILTNLRFRAMSRVRSALRRDLSYEIAPGHVITLPPEHMLPLYQTVHPFYDRYFLDFFRALSDADPAFAFVDVGANVGDTAVAVKSVAAKSRIVCVEGSDFFLHYLKRNVAALDDVEIIDSFVSAGKEGGLEYIHFNGTGRLIEAPSAPAVDTAKFVTVGTVLEKVGGSSLVVWKSDTDGHDVGILLGGFDEIVSHAEVIWFELMLLEPFHPDPLELVALFKRLSELDRDVILVDNFGRVMLRIAASESPTVIADLERWLRLQRASGTISIDYFDIWVMPAPWADRFIASLPPMK